MPLDLTDEQVAALRAILDGPDPFADPTATAPAPDATATVAVSTPVDTPPAPLVNDAATDNADALASALAPTPLPAPVAAPAAPSSPSSSTSSSTSSSSAVAVKDVVSQTTTVGWMHKPITRYGIVVHIDDDSVITGTETDGTDVTTTHATVAWFGADGLTTVPLDELHPIA